MKLVSIIMPVYNVAAQLEKAIQSALNQTYHTIEIILVNDGSTDGSGDICDAYREKDERIKVIHQANAGSGYARNAGLDAASGEYIYFADPDDYFEDYLIEEMLPIMEETAADMAVFGYFNDIVQKNGQINTTTHLPKLNGTLTQKEFQNQFREHYAVSPYALWNKFYRHEFIKAHQHRFTNQKVGQDALFNQSVQQTVQKVVFHQKAYYHYVSMEGSAVNRYRKERFTYEYNIARHFEEWMMKWHKQQDYQDLIYQQYWGALYLELSNLTWKDSPLTGPQKAERIESLMQNQKIADAVYGIDLEKESNAFVKQLLQLLRKKNYAAALRLMKFRVIVGKNFQRSFSWLKQTFSK